MSNIKLKDHNWATKGIYDTELQMTQEEINNNVFQITNTNIIESSSVASFESARAGSKLKQLTVSIEPVQDLHGYNNPWPAGGGKNLFQVTAESTTINGVTITVNSDGSIEISGTATAAISMPTFGTVVLPAGTYKVNGYANGSANSTRLIAYNDTASSSIGLVYQNRDLEFTLAEESSVRLYGVIATDFTGTDTFYPMIRLSSVTDATFAPYSNICPISGWTGCNVYRSGINVWDEDWELGTINIDGVLTPANNRIRSKKVPVKENTDYFVSAPSYGTFFWYDSADGFISYSAFNASTMFAVSTPPKTSYGRFIMGTNYGTTYNNDISINYPATDTAYHAYKGNTIPITFPSPDPGTVYGGTLDVTEKKLLLTHRILENPETGWVIAGGANVFYKSITDYGPGTPICNMYAGREYVSNNAGAYARGNNTICVRWPTVDRIYIRDDRFSNADDFMEAISGITIVIELASPITIPLVGVPEITTLLGTNNIWADCGDISVTYGAYLDDQDEKIATVSKSMESTELSGSVVTFEGSVADMPLKECEVNIEPVQSGSGDPSPENVRPITGWTGANLARTAKNLGNFVDNKSITNSGFIVDVDGRVATVDPVVINPGKTYKAVCNNASAKVILAVWNGDTLVRRTANLNVGTVLDTTGGTYFYVCCYMTGSVSVTVDEIEPMVVFADETDLTYAPYQGTVYPITFPTSAGTVYGGTLDVTNGVLTVDMAMVDLGSLAWSAVNETNDTSSGGLTSTLKKPSSNSKAANMICSAYQVVARSNIAEKTVLANTGGAVIVRDSSYAGMTGAQVASALSGVQLVYELATPIEIPVTPNEITTLLGTNNIWVDCGDISVTYGAYLETVKKHAEYVGDSILSAIAPLETSYKATRDYAIGDYLFVGTKFYKVISPIDKTGDITVDTNVEQTTVAAQLIALANA